MLDPLIFTACQPLWGYLIPKLVFFFFFSNQLHGLK